MTNKREEYRGYAIEWQEPPLTSSGYDVNIASNDPELQDVLENHSRAKGAYTLRAATPEEGRKVAQAYIDRVLG